MISGRWADFDNGVVGDGTFPKPTLEVLAGKDAAGKDVWAPLADGYRGTAARLGAAGLGVDAQLAGLDAADEDALGRPTLARALVSA